MRFKDLSNQRFGRLLVLERTDNIGKFTAFKCKCDCGSIVNVKSILLTTNKTKSCGCYRRDFGVINGHKSLKHGHVGSKLYSVHSDMIARCERLTHHAYDNYGGRGIKVCTEWHDVSLFVGWANKNGYSDSLTLDRVDVNGNYEPSNCRWVTMKIQQNNRRNNHLVTYNNETHNVTEWSSILGIPRYIIQNRLNSKWSAERAFTTPHKSYKRGVK